VQTVKDMGTPKIIAISNRVGSNAQVTTWQTNATEKKDRVMSDVSSVIEIICELQGMCGLQWATKENLFTSPFETIHSYCTNQTNLIHSTRSTICSNNQTKSLLRSHKYRSRATHKPNLSANQWQTGLKNMMKSLFEQMGNMPNLPTTVFTKLK
jgi:hypothetical protein